MRSSIGMTGLQRCWKRSNIQNLNQCKLSRWIHT